MSKRKTHGEFIREVFDLVGSEYTVIGHYTNAKTKLEIMHNECNYVYFAIPNQFLSGRRCPNCKGKRSSKKQAKTHEEFINEIYDLVKDEYIVIGRYINSKTNVKIKHSKCDFEWNVLPNNFTSKHSRCPQCAEANRGKIKRKTHTDFITEVYNNYGDEFTILSKYEHSKSHVKIKHNECGHMWYANPSNIVRNGGCPKCAGNTQKTTEQFKKDVYNLVGDEFNVVGKYIKAHDKVLMVHNACGREFERTPTGFLSDGKCPKCAGYGITPFEFINDVCRLFGDEYIVLNDYTNSTTKVQIKHSRCGHIWDTLPNNLTKGHKGCPKCKLSHGELRISRTMDVNGVNYNIQKVFEDCRNIKPLPFDFIVFNKDIDLIIEYDGEQHFRSVDLWNGEEGFKARKHCDNIKNQYCINNNIPLMRIPYWEFNNIEHILDNVLKYFNLLDGQCADLSIIEKYLVDENWDHDEYINMKQLQTN